jgi:aspartate racemase
MKTIGLIGGMSWESTTLYYQLINREVARRLGGLSSARLNLVSLDFQDIAQRQRAGDWAGMSAILRQAARRLQDTGAQCLLIGTNTMHKLAPEVQADVHVPLIHIADVTADAILAQGLDTVGLLGTRFTMEEASYVDRLRERGIRCVPPDEAQRTEIHRIIFEELCQGEVSERSRAWLSGCIADLQGRGAQGVVLGCTELPLIVGPQDSCLPTFDTTALHAMAAVDFALAA